ncbi:hypothetical protein Pint_09989 [Pistacia integerrima]|uniref:Uncharacterized protein n=1 Tax=Pistacia integerrima TaxID=434235 RepID=A0ACC0XFP4_9ROSI|nr:hypothetical protein Pint_09989 [Pistacia integerrima]
MQKFHSLASFILPSCYVILLPFVGCSSHEEFSQSSRNHKISKEENIHKLSPQMASNITVHGLLLWTSIGFLMPVGILTIRMSSKKEIGSREAKVFFYLHIILQILSVVLVTIGAVMSIKNFENSFDNNHQKLGLALYGAMWVQALIGFFRPPRGNIRRSTWYFLHWLFGTVISLVGIINIYTGLKAYHDKTSRSTTIFTILFTAEICFLAFFYLLQDKWDYMQKQGLILGDNVDAVASSIQVITQRENEKVLPPEPCGKRNALRNLFD